MKNVACENDDHPVTAWALGGHRAPGASSRASRSAREMRKSTRRSPVGSVLLGSPDRASVSLDPTTVGGTVTLTHGAPVPEIWSIVVLRQAKPGEGGRDERIAKLGNPLSVPAGHQSRPAQAGHHAAPA